MEINVGDYVRDKNGRIGKVFDITNEPSVDVGIGIMPEVNAVWIDKDKINYLYQEDITNHSKDIIDLIEVGDLVNGKRVIFTKTNFPKGYCKNNKNDVIFTDYNDEYGEWFGFENDEIETVLTKQQFEQNCYKVEKER